MITRKEFIQAVKNFKKAHGDAQLKELLNLETNPEAVKDFFADPIIHAYLSRSEITFEGQHPALREPTSEEDHDTSDYYELEVYKYLPNLITFRNENIVGPLFSAAAATILVAHTKIDNSINLLIKSLLPDNVQLGPGNTISYSSHCTSFFTHTTAPATFLLNSNWDSGHATTMLSIFEPSSGRRLVTLLLNSVENVEYNNGIKKSFSHRSTPAVYIELNREPTDEARFAVNYLKNRCNIDLDERLKSGEVTTIINKEDGTLVSINYGRNEFNSPKYKEVETIPYIDVYYHFFLGPSGSPVLKIERAPKAPFIDVSHNLQTDSNDKNCLLYSYNFIQAICELLQSKLIDEEDQELNILELARSAATDPRAKQTLTYIFQESLKSFLPQYYDRETGVPKSTLERETYHLNQRWEMGRKILAIKYPLRETVTQNQATGTGTKSDASDDSQTVNWIRGNTIPYFSPLTAEGSSSLFAGSQVQPLKQNNQAHVVYHMP